MIFSNKGESKTINRLKENLIFSKITNSENSSQQLTSVHSTNS